MPGLLLAAALATTALAATAGALEPFAAEYRASYMGLSASGSMTLEPQGSERWKYSLKVTHPIAQLTQITLFEDAKGQWRPLSGSDISLLLTKEIRRHAVYDLSLIHIYAQLIRTIFHDPPSGNVHWREIESLLRHVGATLEPISGARIRITLCLLYTSRCV